MIIFHTFFILDYFQIVPNKMYQGGWLTLARYVQFVFLGLVGISMVISYQRKKENFHLRHTRRAAVILSMAMLISLITSFLVSEEYVKFGILHLIGTSILILNFLIKYKKTNLIIGLTLIIIGFLIKDIPANSTFAAILGLDVKGFKAIDHFPIFPWMGIPAIGIFLGHIFYEQNTKIKIPKLKKIPLISTIGKHSLLIYMIHIPIIITILILFQIIPYQTLLN